MSKRTLGAQVLLATLLIFASVGGAQGQNGFGFDLDVDCDDIELKSLVRSYFSKELRDLGDVRVAEMGAPDYQVDVIASILKRTWTMSVVITAPFVGDPVEEHSSETDASLRGYARRIEHSLTQGNSTNALGDQIADIVKKLDKDVLEPRRKGQGGAAAL